MYQVPDGALCTGTRERTEGNSFQFAVNIFERRAACCGAVWVRICRGYYGDKWLRDESRELMGGIGSNTAIMGVIVAESLTSVIFFFFLYGYVDLFLSACETKTDLVYFQVSRILASVYLYFACTELSAFQWKAWTPRLVLLYISDYSLRNYHCYLTTLTC